MEARNIDTVHISKQTPQLMKMFEKCKYYYSFFTNNPIG